MKRVAIVLFAIANSQLIYGAQPEHSKSPSRQFVIYGADAKARGAISGLAEQTKTDLLGLLRQRDDWKTPVVVNLQSQQSNLPELPPADLRFSQTGFGIKLQLDLTISKNVDVSLVQRELLRAILLEMIYRNQPHITAGALLVEPPDWLIDGALALARVPAPATGAEIAQDPPFDVEPSGIASDGCGRIFVADTADNRIIVELPECRFRYALPLGTKAGSAPGQFDGPAGLAMGSDTLYVVDRGNARVQGFLLPALELHRITNAGLSQPTGVATDSVGRLYVLDRGASRILRFRADGAADAAYAPAMTQPAFLAIGANDMLYASDQTANAVYAFDSNGQRLGAVALPHRDPAVRPRALAVQGNKIYVADAASGKILVFDTARLGCIGSVPGFRAPVSAMAFDSNGDLLVKTDGGESYLRFAANAGCVKEGTLVAGPLDAGLQSDWERVSVQDVTVALETCAQPAEEDWVPSPSPDCLLARDRGPADPTVGERRFLWLRVTLRSADGRASPTLSQVQAQTTGASYLDLLPRIYRRDDQATRFLERWLALFRSGIEDRESEIEFMPRRFDPAMAPAGQLPWLAQALAFDPPQSLTPTQLRALLARIPQLYAQRGTLAGVEALVEIYTGIRPKIIEAYHPRRV